MKIKVNDLNGVALDYAVALAENYTMQICTMRTGQKTIEIYDTDSECFSSFEPSEWYYDGMPIVEREGIHLRPLKSKGYEILDARHYDASKQDEKINRGGREFIRRPKLPHALANKWLAKDGSDTTSSIRWHNNYFVGATLLIAAMRCYVASKLGDTIEIPDELL